MSARLSIAAGLCVFSLVAVGETRPEPETASSEFAAGAAQLAAELDEIRRQNQVPAMGLAIFDAGRPVLIAGYGNASADTPFRWGSITKSFTGLAALTLTRRTAVALETPIREVLGEGYYVNAWAAGHPVRLQDLLALSAGFADLSRAEWNDNEPLPLWSALERFETERRTQWPPGLQHSYSNVAPGLTAAVIERASGMPFESFVRLHLFEPLGMKAASLSPLADLPGGYKADGRSEIPYWHMTFAGFGALNASIREMSRFLSALLNDGRLEGERVLPVAQVETFFTPMATLGSEAGLAVGYGAGVYGWVRQGHLFHGHGGDADGYRSRYGLLRSHGRGYLLVINTDNPELTGRLRRRLETFLLADLPDHPTPAEVEEDLTVYTGTYYPASARFGQAGWRQGDLEPADLRIEEAHLRFNRGRRSDVLISAGAGRFRRPGDPAVSVVITPDETGHLYLQGELGNFVRTSPGSCPEFLNACD